MLQSLLIQLIDLIQGLNNLLGILLRILHTLNIDAASLVDRGVSTVFRSDRLCVSLVQIELAKVCLRQVSRVF